MFVYPPAGGVFTLTHTINLKTKRYIDMNNIVLKISDKHSLSISDLGKGTDDFLEGMLICNESGKLIGDTFSFKRLSSLNELVEKEIQNQ